MFRACASVSAACLLISCGPSYRHQVRMEHGVMRMAGQPAVVGHVVEAETGRPLPFLVVSLDSFPFGMVDTTGYYEIPHVPQLPEGQHEVRIRSRPYLSQSKIFTLREGFTDTVDFALEYGPDACCRLEGAWAVTLKMDSAALVGPRPTARVTGGAILFADSLANDWLRTGGDSRMTYEAGRFDVDLAPFFGGPFAQDVSTTVMGPGGPDLLREASGSVFSGDSVGITLIPRMTHGGLSLSGRILGDSVTGDWIQNAYCCGAYGTFVMRRTP